MAFDEMRQVARLSDWWILFRRSGLSPSFLCSTRSLRKEERSLKSPGFITRIRMEERKNRARINSLIHAHDSERARSKKKQDRIFVHAKAFLQLSPHSSRVRPRVIATGGGGVKGGTKFATKN